MDCLILDTNDQVAQSSKQAPVTFDIVSSIPSSDSWHLCEELVNARQTVVGLLRVLRLQPWGKVK